MDLRHLTARALRRASLAAGGITRLDKAANIVDSRVAWRDGFTSWLTLANAGMMDPGNLHCFNHAVERLPAGAPMVEIGAFCGLSTNLLGHFKRLHGKRNRLISVDPWLFEGAPDAAGMLGQGPVSFGEYRDHVMDSYRRNVRLFSKDDLPAAVELTSDAFFAAWDRGETVTDLWGEALKLGGGLSMVFVDGNHSYPFARRDVDNAARNLVAGGWLFLDDSGDGSGWEVTRVVDELRRDPRFRHVMANPNHLFEKVG